MRVAVLLSGGVDSVTALYEATAAHEVAVALTFHYGSKHNDREIPCAEWHARKLDIPHCVMPLGFIGEYFSSDLLISGGAIPKGRYSQDNMRRTVVPFRNGIFLAVAAGFAESCHARALIIAAHAGDHAIYPDCREEFLDAQSEAIRLGTHAGIQVLRPLVSLDKAGIIRRGHALGVDFARTWSCYEGGDVHCGECATCIERREAFLQAGIPDPTLYRDATTDSPRC